jgi:alanine dehydrogenase
VARNGGMTIGVVGAGKIGATIAALLESCDFCDAVLLPGAKAPKLITREMLHVMKPGTVFVDIAIDQGGCAETSRPTTHDSPTFVEEDVIHYCVTNMPGAYARTATQALTNVTFPYVQWLAEGGIGGACAKHPELKSGINIQEGRVTNEAVAAAHGLPFSAAMI